MSKVYDFNAQLSVGERGANIIDKYLESQGWEIRKVADSVDRIGIDRMIIKNALWYSVEYKTDQVAAKSHNAFIEIDSYNDQPGWALTSAAQVIMYYVPGEGIIYVLDAIRFKQEVNRWTGNWDYPVKEVQNKGWITRGVLVPLVELEAIAIAVHGEDVPVW